jgi:predicted transcriptional regulator/KaiC/GvpD/RAD55 family RecA-like ATPase
MPKRRNKYEIYSELLDTVARKHSCRLTRASYGANLPVDRAKVMLTFLASRGFISESKVAGSTIYTITKRGLEYLETFKNMRKLFAALDERRGLLQPEARGEPRRISKIEANLTLMEDHVLVDEEVRLGVTVANIGETSVTLKSVEKIVPENFEVVVMPDNFYLKGNSIVAEEVNLDPGSTEEFRLDLRAPCEGTYSIHPRIISLGDNGEEVTFEPSPAIVKVVEADLPRRLSTGSKDLDNLLLGGVPEKYAMILTSPPCDERDLLTLRFLNEGLKQKETTIYFATDANMMKTLAREVSPNFYIFICNPQADAIIDNRPNVFKLKGVENLTDINIALTSAFRKMNRKPDVQKRACIGILSDILLEHGAVRTRKWLTGFLSELKSQEFTSMVLLNPQMHPSEEVQAVLDPFEGEIEVYAKQTKEGVQKFLRIRRMFNQRYLENEMPLVKDRLRP